MPDLAVTLQLPDGKILTTGMPVIPDRGDVLVVTGVGRGVVDRREWTVGYIEVDTYGPKKVGGWHTPLVTLVLIDWQPTSEADA